MQDHSAMTRQSQIPHDPATAGEAGTGFFSATADQQRIDAGHAPPSVANESLAEAPPRDAAFPAGAGSDDVDAVQPAEPSAEAAGKQAWEIAQRALEHSRNSRHDEAIGCWHQAIELMPGLAAYHHALGNALADAGLVEAAIDSFRESLSLDDTRGDCWLDLGTQLQHLGQQKLNRQRTARPGTADEHDAAAHEIQDELAAEGRALLEEGQQCYVAAVQRDPNSPAALNNLGASLHREGRFFEAIDCYRQAVLVAPEFAGFHVNLGNALSDCGESDAALACCDAALELQPRNAQAHMSRAFTLLRESRFAEGWEEYRWRFARNGRRDLVSASTWQGEPLDGRPLRILAEQGPGDQIMFASCLADLPQDGPITVECDQRIIALLTRSFPQYSFVPPLAGGTAGRDAGEVQIPLGSLPGLLRNSVESFPREAAILQADDEASRQWRAALQQEAATRPLTGIVWRGGQAGSLGDWRSTAIDDWAPLLEVEEPVFVSLQGDARNHELERGAELAGNRLRRLNGFDLTRDLETLAACIAALDLVVTVDCTVAHLAAALGVETWILLPFAADWRWQRTGETSLWYGTARLFRQSQPNQWGDVFAGVEKQLQGWLNSRTVLAATAGEPPAEPGTVAEDSTTAPPEA